MKKSIAILLLVLPLAAFAQQVAEATTPLYHDGLAFGFLHYTAQARPGNLGRNGRHEQIWFIDQDGQFQTFEPGEGQQELFLPAELASITLLFAQ